MRAGSSPQCIAPLAIGVVCLIAASVNELFTKRSPIVPPRLFKVSDCYASLSMSTEQLIVTYFRQTRTTAVILISTFLHALGFFAGTYYLPVYFQVIGSSATIAGVR